MILRNSKPSTKRRQEALQLTGLYRRRNNSKSCRLRFEETLRQTTTLDLIAGSRAVEDTANQWNFTLPGYKKRAKELVSSLDILNTNLVHLINSINNPNEFSVRSFGEYVGMSVLRDLLRERSLRRTDAQNLGLNLPSLIRLAVVFNLPTDNYSELTQNTRSKAPIDISTRVRDTEEEHSLGENIFNLIHDCTFESMPGHDTYALNFDEFIKLETLFHSHINDASSTEEDRHIAHLYLALTQILLGKHHQAIQTIRTALHSPGIIDNAPLNQSLNLTCLFLERELGLTETAMINRISQDSTFANISDTTAQSLIPMLVLQNRFKFKAYQGNIIKIRDLNNQTKDTIAEAIASQLMVSGQDRNTIKQLVRSHLDTHSQINIDTLLTDFNSRFNLNWNLQTFQKNIFSFFNQELNSHRPLVSWFDLSTLRASEVFDDTIISSSHAIYQNKAKDGIEYLQKNNLDACPFNAALLYSMQANYIEAAKYIQKALTSNPVSGHADFEICKELFQQTSPSVLPLTEAIEDTNASNAFTNYKKMQIAIYNMFVDTNNSRYWASQAEHYALTGNILPYVELERIKISTLLKSLDAIKAVMLNANPPGTGGVGSGTPPGTPPTGTPPGPTPTGTPPGTTPTGNPATQTTQNINWWLWGGAGTGLTALIGGIIWYFAGQDDPTKRKPLQPGQQSPNGGGYSAYVGQQSPNAGR